MRDRVRPTRGQDAVGGCATGVRSAPAVEDRSIGSEEPWSLVGHLDGEPSVVHEPVVTPAEKDEVGKARRAAVRPMTNVMRVAPAGRSNTAGERTPAITNRNRASKRGRHHLGLPSHVERLGGGIGDDAGDVRVARPSSRRLGGHRAGVLESTSPAEPALKRLEVHGHHDVRALTGHHRTVGEVEPLPADLTERIRPALGGRAGIGLGTGTVPFAGSVSPS
jgi:hypothetical protein